MSNQLQPEHLLGTSEVAVVLGVRKQQIHALRKNAKFPAPITILAATPIWDKREVDAFLAQWRPWKVTQ
jgi:predicted DNA-binding transcriptional regulator AlpA